MGCKKLALEIELDNVLASLVEELVSRKGLLVLIVLQNATGLE